MLPVKLGIAMPATLFRCAVAHSGTGKFFLYVRNLARKWQNLGVWPASGAGQTPNIDHFRAGFRTYKNNFPARDLRRLDRPISN